jgi:hypothetical protein
MDVAKAEFIILYVIAIIMVDILTWKAEIPLKFRIVCAFTVTILFIILKVALGIH